MSHTESVDVCYLVRQDPKLALGNTKAVEEVLISSQLPELRQEVHALQTEVDSNGKSDDDLLMRVGLSSYLLSQHEKAVGYLSRVPRNGLASFFCGLAHSSLSNHEEAAQKFQQAAEFGFDRIDCELHRAGAIRMSGRLDEAEALLKSIAKDAAGKAEYSFQVGCIWADYGDTLTAIEYFERAVDMDPYHSSALFRLAAENANRGNDVEAIRLYEQSLSRPPFYMGAMLNLGLLYEDNENYRAAAFCFQRILEVDPNHARAEMYLKDIEATKDMYYDESLARDQARMEQLLSRPISDFELSVRSRNCLAGMNINTLGDLTVISEQELLAGKNFGETSLHEIREVMSSHGLTVGKSVNETFHPDLDFGQKIADLSPEEQELAAKPISELNLSVRSRKCMNRLGIKTFGELLPRTPDELLSSRNFGVTSLNEIRSKLAEMNLKLRND